MAGRYASGDEHCYALCLSINGSERVIKLLHANLHSLNCHFPLEPKADEDICSMETVSSWPLHV